MSRILKKKKLIAAAGCLLAAELLVCLLARSTVAAVLFAAADALGACRLLEDRKVYVRLKRQMIPFGAKSPVRNLDCLVIGEICDPSRLLPQGAETYARIIDPGVSGRGAALALERTHSILRKNGTVILVLRKNRTRAEDAGVMETFFLHRITVQELGLEKASRRQKLVLFIHPFRGLKVLLDRKETGFVETEPDETLKRFCADREIGLKVFVR